MKALVAILRGEVVAVYGAVSSLVAVASAFGLQLTADQTAGVVLVANLVLTPIVRALVTPSSVPPVPPPVTPGA